MAREVEDLGEPANSEGSKAKRMNIKEKTSSTVKPQQEKKKKNKNNNEHSKNPPDQDRNAMTDANDETPVTLQKKPEYLAESEGSKGERMNTKAKKSSFVQPKPVKKKKTKTMKSNNDLFKLPDQERNNLFQQLISNKAMTDAKDAKDVNCSFKYQFHC